MSSTRVEMVSGIRSTSLAEDIVDAIKGHHTPHHVPFCSV
jgi:hypothetical protein